MTPCKHENITLGECYETDVVTFEHERNQAMDRYFGARPQLDRTIHNERVFEAGFRMAWDRLKPQLTKPDFGCVEFVQKGESE